jgi:hypothetical protein
MLIVTFSIIFWFKSYATKVNSKYPAVDCTVIQDVYGAKLEKWAVNELANSDNGLPL